MCTLYIGGGVKLRKWFFYGSGVSASLETLSKGLSSQEIKKMVFFSLVYRGGFTGNN